MCSAIARRIRLGVTNYSSAPIVVDTGSTLATTGSGIGVARVAGVVGVGTGAVATDWDGVGAACRWATYAKISSLRTRPPVPVPAMELRSTSCSRARRRARGEIRWRSSSSLWRGWGALRAPLPTPISWGGTTPAINGGGGLWAVFEGGAGTPTARSGGGGGG